MDKKFSIIVPTKNEECNIESCLLSVKAQNYKNWEIIVVDNHSDDKTVLLAQKYTAKIFISGLERSNQRNFGAQKATGDILFFLDADMTLDKNVLSETAKLLENDIAVKAVVIPEKTVGNHFWARVRAFERVCYLGEPAIEAARSFVKSSFLKIGGFDKNLIAAEDWDLTQRLAKIGKIGRIESKITHHEDYLSLFDHLRKKYYYAKNIKHYAQKYPEKFKEQSGLLRLKIFVKNWRKLAAKPTYAAGVFVLKSLEYFIYILAKAR